MLLERKKYLDGVNIRLNHAMLLIAPVNDTKVYLKDYFCITQVAKYDTIDRRFPVNEIRINSIIPINVALK